MTFRLCRTGSCVFLLALVVTGCRPPETAEPAAVTAPAPPDLRRNADLLLADYRRLIVLVQGEKDLPPEAGEAVAGVGQMLFHSLQQRQQALQEQAGDIADPALVPALDALLERIENEPAWFDADRLAFKELLADIGQRFQQAQSIAGLRLARRALDDLATLGEIEQAYDRELKDVFGRFARRGIVPRREKWAAYVARLQSLYRREQILQDHGVVLPAADTPAPALRGTPRAAADAREIFGTGLPPRTLLLTFDDGPHGTHTDAVLEILKRYGAPAIFFTLGQNLGRVDPDGTARPGARSAVARRILAAGHQLADHSFSHGQMTRMSPAVVRKEAGDTEALLDAAGRTGPLLFRFPYGARNASVLATVEDLKLRSMMWSVDSLDWADPVPRSIADRVLTELEKAQRGIVLFHDIQARTVQALPLVLDQLVADGWRFATWRDGGFVVAPMSPRAQPADSGAALAASGGALYRESHALVIGIDRYAHWPGLHHAVADARAIRQVLV